MRNFLPIKGPGGRYLTPKEKVALLVLGLTLVLCVLTVLAGESAYDSADARNPIFSIVGLLCRTMGGGIVALYGLVLVWSGLIYFKGEKVADVAPFGGRLFAALAVTVGVSGALGIANLQTAGDLGLVVGNALARTFGAGVGFPILLLLMLLGVHLASQGSWHAWQNMPVGALAAPRAPVGFTPDELPTRRFAEQPMPVDGDPTPDERSLAVTQAMEEIERSQGVTIIDIEPDQATRRSIGEEVDDAPPPPPESDEAEVQERLLKVAESLAPRSEEYEATAHPLVPVPVGETGTAPQEELAEGETEEEELEEEEDEEYEAEEAEYEEEGEEEEEGEDEEEEEYDAEEAEYEEEDVEEEEADEEEEDEEYEVDELEEEAEEDDEEEEEASEEPEEIEEPVVAAAADDAPGETEIEEEPEAQADGFAEDPYARGGLLRRMQKAPEGEDGSGDGRRHTTFDWRGRPIG